MKRKATVISLGASTLLGMGALTLLQDSSSVAYAQAAPLRQTDPTEQAALLVYEQNTVDVVNRYGNSVVAINVEARGNQDTAAELPEGFEDFLEQVPPQFRNFLQPPEGPSGDQAPLRQGSGSGFVVDEAGRIVTNYHVVQAALQEGSVELTEGSSVTVTFPSSDEELPVSVVGVNTLYDLALLELDEPGDLPDDAAAIPIADSAAVRIGQKTIAIGNPFGFESSVSTGIVSALGRDQQSIGQVNVPYIQTDAAINPGNSGGPLLNSEGELIGINTAIISGRSTFGPTGNLGIGFAVPSNLLRENLAQLEAGGLVSLASKPRLGIAVLSLSELPTEVRDGLNLPDEGVLIQQIEEGSAAAQAGLKAGELEVSVANGSILVGGDVITAANDNPVTNAGDLQDIVFGQSGGSTVTLEVLRDGESLQVDVTLAVVREQAEEERQRSL